LDEKQYKGSFDYTKSERESSKHKIGIEFKKNLYETKNKKILYFLGGSIYHNYDLFKTTYHLNGFTQLGIEF
jgi:hypothetical protein